MTIIKYQKIHSWVIKFVGRYDIMDDEDMSTGNEENLVSLGER